MPGSEVTRTLVPGQDKGASFRFGPMHHLLVTTCRVPMHHMQQFTALVQRWEQDALAADDGPNKHAVYLHGSDPSRVLMVTEFDSREQAERFQRSGLVTRLEREVLACADDHAISADGYDVYYAADADGHRTVFGEDG